VKRSFVAGTRSTTFFAMASNAWLARTYTSAYEEPPRSVQRDPTQRRRLCPATRAGRTRYRRLHRYRRRRSVRRARRKMSVLLHDRDDYRVPPTSCPRQISCVAPSRSRGTQERWGCCRRPAAAHAIAYGRTSPPRRHRRTCVVVEVAQRRNEARIAEQSRRLRLPCRRTAIPRPHRRCHCDAKFFEDVEVLWSGVQRALVDDETMTAPLYRRSRRGRPS